MKFTLLIIFLSISFSAKSETTDIYQKLYNVERALLQKKLTELQEKSESKEAFLHSLRNHNSQYEKVLSSNVILEQENWSVGTYQKYRKDYFNNYQQWLSESNNAEHLHHLRSLIQEQMEILKAYAN